MHRGKFKNLPLRFGQVWTGPLSFQKLGLPGSSDLPQNDKCSRIIDGMGSLGNRAIARACQKCGKQLRTSREADRHCRGDRHDTGRKPKPATCPVCGKLYPSSRAAHVCCQQRGLQRVDGYVWRNHESVQRAYGRRVAEIRSDPAEMAEVTALAEVLLEMMPHMPNTDE